MSFRPPRLAYFKAPYETCYEVLQRQGCTSGAGQGQDSPALQFSTGLNQFALHKAPLSTRLSKESTKRSALQEVIRSLRRFAHRRIAPQKAC